MRLTDAASSSHNIHIAHQASIRRCKVYLKEEEDERIREAKVRAALRAN